MGAGVCVGVIEVGKGVPVTLSGSSAGLAINELTNWTKLMQVGGYRPRFRPHRRVIETPGRYSRLFPAAFLVLAGKYGSGDLRGFAILALQPAWARFDHSLIQPQLRLGGRRPALPGMRRVWPAMPSDSPAVHRLCFGCVYQLAGWCAVTSSTLLSAACQGDGRSLQACYKVGIGSLWRPQVSTSNSAQRTPGRIVIYL